MAASGAQAIGDISNSAARAAAGAYAAVAPTPLIGPELAPAAAAAALAAALAFGGEVVSAAGGWGQVPYDGALASLHKDEMVLPSSIASPLRDQLAGAGSGSGAGGGGATHHHWTINALDAQSFARMARSNPDAITGALSSAAQRLTLTPAPAWRPRAMSSYPYLPVRWLVTTPDLADDPDVFPRLPGQGFVAEKTPVWSTTVRTAASGRQVRASQCVTPTWRFKVAYEFIRDRITPRSWPSSTASSTPARASSARSSTSTRATTWSRTSRSPSPTGSTPPTSSPARWRPARRMPGSSRSTS